MATMKKQTKGLLPSSASNLKILSDGQYKTIRSQGNIIQIHIPEILFEPQKVTNVELEKLLSSKVPRSGTFKAIILSNKKFKTEYGQQLEDALTKVKNQQGNWHLFYRCKNRKREDAKVKKLLPHGYVPTEAIDAALKGLSHPAKKR